MRLTIKLSPEVAQAILAANDPGGLTTTFGAVQRLEGAGGARHVRVVSTGVEEDAFVHVARGFTHVAEVVTWHPDRAGDAPTVAEVLAQLPDWLRAQVAGVQIVGVLAPSIVGPIALTRDGSPVGFEPWLTWLYRTSRPVEFVSTQPLKLGPNGMIDETGRGVLAVAGVLAEGEWVVTVRQRGHMIGALLADAATPPEVAGDVSEAARAWLLTQLPSDVEERYYGCVHGADPAAEQQLVFDAEMGVALRTLHDA